MSHARSPETSSPAERTEILRGLQDVFNATLNFTSNACSIDTYADSSAPSLAMGSERARKTYEDLHSRRVKLRWVTEVTNENLRHCKALMQYADVRHLNGVKGNFAVSDTEYLAAADVSGDQKSDPKVIYSSSKSVVEQNRRVFDTLWSAASVIEDRIIELENNALRPETTASEDPQVQYRIKELERKEEPTVTRIIKDPVATQEKYRQLVSSAAKEVMLFLPTSTAYRRENKIGLFDSLQTIAERGVQVKILVPGSDGQDNIEQELKLKLQGGPIEVRHIVTPAHVAGRAKIAIADRKEYLMIEIKDDSKDTFVEAVGSSIFSNSESAVQSYLTMFESLWGQSELYEKVEAHDRIQREFINVAAHELRTPTQAVLGYSELLLQSENIAPESEEMLVSLNRNAIRLHNLISYVLDVSRIEAGRLLIEKERVDLTWIVASALEGIEPQIKASGKGIEIEFEPRWKSQLIVNVDKDKILQALSNLLDNAVKFSPRGGRILVSAGREENEVVVRIRDFGPGIDPTVFPRLFEKFVTKSEKGTGLGLFISKSMVEAHGGRIWAENNPDGRGAAFGFALPLT